MKTINLSALLVFSLVVFSKISAQQNFTSVKEGSTITISGTSSLHDWEMQVEDFNCSLAIALGNPSIKIESANFKVKSKSLKSHNSIMDDKTYDALKADKYPEIRFKISSGKDILLNSKTFQGTVSGEIYLAGKTKTLNIPFSGKLISDDKIQISGSKKLRMTEYEIEPPTAMFGTLKTGDEVTITFNLIFNKE